MQPLAFQRHASVGFPWHAGKSLAREAPPPGYADAQSDQRQLCQVEPQFSETFQHPQQPHTMGGTDANGLKRISSGKGSCAKCPRLEAETLVFFSRGADHNDVFVRTLSGSYVASGTNHGRTVYRKSTLEDVWLYYWDRGPLVGWWFGNTVGGTQVWSHCPERSVSPPETGWRVPWDGSVRPLVLMPESMYQERSGGDQFTAKAQSVVEAAAAALEALDGEGESTHLEEALDVQLSALQDLASKLEMHQDVLRVNLTEQVRALTDSVSSRLASLREARIAEVASSRESQEREAATAAVAECADKANRAEELVEQASITREMVTDDETDARNTVEHVETLARAAQLALGEARMCINCHSAGLTGFTESVRGPAMVQVEDLQTRLEVLQGKLNPLKGIRFEMDQRREARRLSAEFLEQISLAEMEMDRVEDILSQFGQTSGSTDLESAKQSFAGVERQGAFLFFLDSKIAKAKGAMLDEMMKLRPRADALSDRASDLKASFKKACEWVVCNQIVQEASERVQEVSEALVRASEAEGALMLKPDHDRLEECEEALQLATQTAALARTFLGTKLVEVKRIPSEGGQMAAIQLVGYQELGSATERIKELKSKLAEQRRLLWIQDIEHIVCQMELDAHKLPEESQFDIDDVADVVYQVVQAVDKAQRFIREVRKDGTRDVAEELLKYQNRIGVVEAEVLRVRQILGERPSKVGTPSTHRDLPMNPVSTVEHFRESILPGGAPPRGRHCFPEARPSVAPSSLPAKGCYVDPSPEMGLLAEGYRKPPPPPPPPRT